MKKFELTSEFVTFLGKKLFRIKALVAFGDVKEGELGGFVEKEENLDQSGNARVFGNARVSGNAHIQCCRDCSAASCFGSENRTTTFFREKDGGIGVRCGCFYGTMSEFREKVKERHGDSRLAKEYLMLADLMEFRLSKDE